MKQPHITRRQFFKINAFGAGALALPAVALASVATTPSQAAQAATVEPHQLAIPQPTFNPIASTTVFGPPTDISAGWDGTLWAIDASGAPHLYDPTADTWNAYGEGIEAATAIGNTLYVFKGGYYITVDLTTKTVSSGPTSVATTWPSLPDSFKLRLTGATSQGGKLILFNGGWYVYADGSKPRAKLTDINGWPTTANWVDGVIDAVYLDQIRSLQYSHLIRGDEYIDVSFDFLGIPSVILGPTSVKGLLPPSLATTGTDAATYIPLSSDTCFFHGTSVVVVPDSGGADQTYYIPKLFAQWPVTWNPMLNHAPSGRMGNLWCTTTAQGQDNIVQHDGENWNTIPGRGPSIAIGQDNSVYVVSGDNQTIDKLVAGTGWVATATAPVQLTKVAVGDDDHVFVLGNDSSVHRLVGSSGAYSYTPVNLGAGVPNPTHIAANADGTLWHCNSGNANAYRFLSDANAPQAGIPIKQGIVSAVQKVATTGFGAAYCLAQQNGQTQAYRYDSPYIFKTPSTYSATTRGPLAVGLGMVYITAVQSFTNPDPQERTFLVALDAHTGAEISRSAVRSSDTQLTHGLPTFDPVNNLIYVGTHDYFNQDNVATAGLLLALDARDLTKVVWSYATPASIDAKPVVAGTTLTFGDRTGTLYHFDTTAALAQASNPQPTWTWKPAIGAATTYRVAPPLLTDDKLVTVFWDFDQNNKPTQAWMGICNADDGSESTIVSIYTPQNPASINIDTLLTQPVQGTVAYETPSGLVAPGYYCNGGDGIFAAGSGQTVTFYLPAGTSVTTGVSYDADTQTTWFGAGPVLYALNKNLSPVSYTPFTFDGGPGRLIYTRPVIYTDPKGGKTILTGLYDQSATSGSLYGFDPDNGNVASIQTGVTLISALSEDVTNGVVYASGTITALGSANGFSQVFGIRVDKLPQALRDFVIESQMMQDPDQNASGGSTDPNNPIPPSVARYQTHLTVVDDQKNPQVHEPVKIWCDTANTNITVDGQSFTVGPDDASFAAVKTGADGSLVITMDATDYFAPTLRVWASFMDPYERIVVNADAEFHQRVMTAHANASDDDPDKVNLMTAMNYKGTSLFTAVEKNQNPSAPQNVANSIQKVNAGLGLSSANSKGMYRKLMRAMGVKHKNQRVQVQFIEAAPPPDKYMAYADLPGATHFPTNIPSMRLASIVQPVGLSFSRPNGDCTKAPAFSAISHADARTAIDALEGTPWQPSDPHSSNPGQCVPPQAGASSDIGPRRAFNIFQDFWNWLKGLIDKVTQCILSIAEDILAGIQYIVNGILKVFKAIIKVLEDVFPFLGSFFKMLEKLIDDVVAALSVLFHFGEIMKTHRWMASEIVTTLNQARTVITTSVQPAIDGFFELGEDAIKGFFDQIRSQFNPGQGIKNLKGSDATAHTAFAARAGSAGSNSGGSSHAVQCTWGTQKLKGNMPNAAEPTLAAGTIQSAADDPLSAFVTKFVARITNDQDLGSVFDQLKSDLSSLFHVSSAKQFFTTLLDTLLDIVEALLIGMLAVSNGLIDGMIGVIEALFDAVMGFLTNPIDFPVISWLYRTLFGDSLNFLNLITLVAAIPVTIIYRVVEGHYPSADGITDTSSTVTAHGTRVAAVAPSVMAKIFASFGAVFALGLGIARAFVDNAGANPPPTGVKLVLLFGLLYAGCYFPLITTSTPNAYAWSSWGIGLVLAFLGTFGIVNLAASDATKQVFKYALPILRSALGLVRLVVICVGFVKSGKTDATSDVAFVRNIFLEWPPILNPIKLIPEVGPLALTIVDGVTGVVVCGLDFYLAFGTSSPDPRPSRLHFPWVPHSPLPAAAHP